MTSEQLRKSITAQLVEFFGEKFPTTAVNYPNRLVVDIEKHREPFITVEFLFSGVDQITVGKEQIVPEGSLNLYLYYLKNTGISAGTTFADEVIERFNSVVFGDTSFGKVKTNKVQTFPGWEGLLARIPFKSNVR